LKSLPSNTLYRGSSASEVGEIPYFSTALRPLSCPSLMVRSVDPVIPLGFFVMNLVPPSPIRKYQDALSAKKNQPRWEQMCSFTLQCISTPGNIALISLRVSGRAGALGDAVMGTGKGDRSEEGDSCTSAFPFLGAVGTEPRALC
jgi:hypothetical protein